MKNTWFIQMSGNHVTSLFRVAVGLLAVCGLGALSGQAALTSLRMAGEPGESLAPAQGYSFGPSDGTFSAQKNSGNGVSLSFQTQAYGHWFYLDFAAPGNQLLNTSLYTGATRFPFQQSTEPGLSIYGDGIGCNTDTGIFEVKQVVYGAANQISSFWATFEQHCDGQNPALLGEIRFNVTAPVIVDAPLLRSSIGGRNLSFTVTATEAQNRHVTLTSPAIPPGGSFVDNGDSTGTFSWTPASDAVGEYSIKFQGDNGVGASDTAATRILVTLANDDFSNATQIASIPYTNRLDTTSATTASDDPYSCSYPSHTVWYALKPTHNLRLSASSVGSDYGTLVSVFTGTCFALNQVACNDDGSGFQSDARFNAQAGTNYYFMVGSIGDSVGQLNFSLNEVLPPANDDFDHAIPITSLPWTNSLDAEAATLAADDPTGCNQPGATVWYSLTPSEDLFIHADTLASDYQVVLSVYTGTRGALQLTECFGGDQLRFVALKGQTYYLMVGSFFGAPGGRATLAVRSYPLLKLGVVVNSVGSFDPKTGVTTVSGTLTSSQPVTVGLNGTVRQNVGRFHVITGQFGGENNPFLINCPGSAPWSAQVVGNGGTFGGGAAAVFLTAGAYDPNSDQGAVTNATATVQLRRAH
jgi:hypothetical protein